MEPSSPTTHCRLALWLILPAYLATLVQGACAPYPVPLRLGNVSLSNGKEARGVELTVGTPEQKFALIPHNGQNGTLLYATNGVCDPNGANKWSRTSCTTLRGGSYDSAASNTSKPTSDNVFIDDDGWPGIKPITDATKLSTNVTLDDFAMGMVLSDADVSGSTMMFLGLAKNSTILSALKNSGKIASRTWSLFWGRGFGMPSQSDGHIIFGGYDRAKASGQRHTEPMTIGNAHCKSQLIVTVTDLTLNFDNGSDVSLFTSGSEPFPSCIMTEGPLAMRMHFNPFFSNMMRKTSDNTISTLKRALGYYYWTSLYGPQQKPYEGALTITLSSGLKIRLDRDQLITPHVYLHEQSGEMLLNATEHDLLIDPLGDDGNEYMAQFGFQFLSAAYLQVNYETSEFSLWAANPTADEDIVALDPSGKDVTEYCAVEAGDGNEDANSGGNSGGDSGAGGGSDAPSTEPSKSSPTLSPGVIAGIAVGGAAVGALIVGAAVWFCRRRKSKAKSSTPPDMVQDTHFKPELQADELPRKTPLTSELDNGHAPFIQRYEIGDNVDPRYTRRYEMPG
ncbi:hypothetical protein CMUS01_07897 [Colletotrichum musicola]|uniref:Peptidase A1 domain-containing protein n=1 Tax=Colletotrichum musicola TaxID=2175873 RepID=A0A8H6KEQ7_9PEZI|nr:hypothetical protein CMUS01_07897 [Colletotrichum musicola]